MPQVRAFKLTFLSKWWLGLLYYPTLTLMPCWLSAHAQLLSLPSTSGQPPNPLPFIVSWPFLPSEAKMHCHLVLYSKSPCSQLPFTSLQHSTAWALSIKPLRGFLLRALMMRQCQPSWDLVAVLSVTLRTVHSWRGTLCPWLGSPMSHLSSSTWWPCSI